MAVKEAYSLLATTPRRAAGDASYSSTLRERLSTSSRVQQADSRKKRQQSSIKKATTLQNQLKSEFQSAVDPQSHYRGRTLAPSNNGPSDPLFRLAGQCFALVLLARTNRCRLPRNLWIRNPRHNESRNQRNIPKHRQKNKPSF